MKIAERQIEDAVQQLRRSERGQGSAQLLLDFFNGGGLGLDAENQRAVMTLIMAAWRAATLRCDDGLASFFHGTHRRKRTT